MSGERPHPNIAIDRRGAIEVLRIDREEALGALNSEMMAAIGSHANRLRDRKDETRVLILTGTGRGFVAGADIDGYHDAPQVVFDDFQRLSRQTFDAIANLPQATICAVNGYALGGGFELAMCCDFILVNEKARLGLPEIRLGLLPGGGGTQRLPRLVGAMRAKEILMTGRMISAAEAVEYGAALETCTQDGLMPRALEFAEELAKQAPVALREAKRAVDDGLDAALSAGLTMEQRILGALFATGDGKEGIAAFMEKRDPVFKGN